MKVYIGDKGNRQCRYCEKSQLEVKFENEAHAVPEFIGNKSLVAFDECDTCNEIFSRVIEDHLGKYLGVQRTLAQISGKKGVPKYKSRDNKSRIALEDTGLKISSSESNPIHEIDTESKTLKIVAHRQPYVPAAVFKCLVKMAIAIAPNELLPELIHLTKWIILESHTYKSFPYSPLIVFEQITPGPLPYNGISLILLKRKNKNTSVPYLQFIVTFGNTMFQIILPMPSEDKHLMKKPINITLYPTPFDADYEYGKTTFKQIDMSGFDIIKNEEHVLYMSFDSINAI